jgi:RNA polymerase sigma factor (TIGR02999 family)
VDVGIDGSKMSGCYLLRGTPVKLASSHPRMRAGRDRTPPGGAARARIGDAPGRPSATGSMDDVTRILSAAAQGDARAAEQLLPLVYDELRKLAAARLASEAPGQTLDATALVHDAYLRLVGPHDPGWDGRAHFFAAAAEAMRRILVERARRKRRLKHGGGRSRQDRDLDDLAGPDTRDPAEVLAVHEAPDRLAERAPRKAELVKLRYFVGCTMAEAAQVLGVAPSTAEDDWTYSKAWLRRRLRGEPKKGPPG